MGEAVSGFAGEWFGIVMLLILLDTHFFHV